MTAALARWLREEWRLACIPTWANGAYATPVHAPCTLADPRCAALAVEQAKLYARMRRMRSRALDRDDLTTSMHTDVRATINAARRDAGPTVQLVRRAK